MSRSGAYLVGGVGPGRRGRETHGEPLPNSQFQPSVYFIALAIILFASLGFR